ncbi:UNVERIFIED_ORG: hypothetical protein MaF1660_ph0045 [Mycobacterium phage Adler]
MFSAVLRPRGTTEFHNALAALAEIRFRLGRSHLTMPPRREGLGSTPQPAAIN